MKKFSILALLVLTGCSCINFAKDDGLIKHDDMSSITDKVAEGQ